VIVRIVVQAYIFVASIQTVRAYSMAQK